MKNYYKTFTNYNGYSARSSNARYQKNTPYVKTGGRNYEKLASYEKNYKHFNEGLDNILSRELSKKKNRGVLDVSSIGNKDVLTDSDSEATNTKENSNKKGKCATLIIEKVERQTPRINEEYYKFTNQKKISPYNDKVYNSNNRFTFNKKLQVSPYGNYNNSFYKNKIYQSQEYENFAKFHKKQGNDLYSYKTNNYNNYSVNRVLTTDDSSISKNNYNYNNDKKRDSFSNNNYIGNMIVVNKSPYMKNSIENSIEKNSSSFNQIYQPRKINFFEEYNTGSRTSMNNDENYIQKRTLGLRKNLAPKEISQISLSRYGNYKNLSQKPQLSQIINVKYNPKTPKSYLPNRFNDKLIKNVIKIQSFWRGAFTRELMTFFMNLNLLRDSLNQVFKSHLREYFYYFLNNIKDYQKPKRISVGSNNKNDRLRHKFLVSRHKGYKNNQKNNDLYNNDSNDNSSKVSPQEKPYEEKYNKLLEDYNSLLDKYNRLEEKNNNEKKNSFDKLDINSNNFEIIYKKGKINSIKSEQNKKFEVIEPGQKEELNIIQKKNEKKNSTEKSLNNIRYEDYLNHFISNISKINDNQLYIKKTCDKNIKNEKPTIENKKPELIQENQKNLNTEIKGMENNKLKIFKDCIVNEHNNNINIIQVNDKKIKRDMVLNIVSEEIKFDIIESNKSNKEKKTKRKSKNKNKPKEKIVNDNDSDINKELVIEKKEDILLVEKNKLRKFDDDMIIIDKNNTLVFESSKKDKSDEITEITEELNKIEPSNHNELVLEGIIMDLNQKLDNIQKEKEKENNSKNNYYENNEIEKGEALEINPMEMKRTKNNINNIFISYENKMDILNSKNDIFTEKAKRNMMKIILPIRLKSTLREYVRKNTYPLLISNLKKIALSINSKKSDDNENEKESTNN